MKDLEAQLRQDAKALQSVGSVADMSDLRERLPGREQNVSSTTSTPSWLAWLLPLTVATAALWILVINPTADDAGFAPTLPPVASTNESPIAPVDLGSIELVSSTAPLQAEWDALVQDIERARALIEEDLPVSF
ncbi:MAG: hypothetical protein AAFQ99_04395 [Pseudomonadota bacterium]